jgi:biotin carboxylase
VYRIDTPAELRLRFAEAIAGIQDMFWLVAEADGVDLGPQGLLVESFLDGREYLMEALAWDDEVYLGSVVDRITAEGQNFDDDVHHAPTTLPAEELARVHHVVRAAAHAQGLRRSVMHAEVRYHQGKPHILEIAARVGGGGLDEIARQTAEYDPIRSVVDVGQGVRPPVRHYWPTGVHITAMCLICDGGVVRRIDVPAEVSESDRVFLLKITAHPGDTILRPPHGNTIFGFLGTTGTSQEDAFDEMTALAAKINVTLED